LLQHLAVTLAALSIVRERSGGTMELFRVSPLAAAEALNGKYLSYLVFGGIIAAILVGLLVFVLHLPMLGNWVNLILVLTGILFTSLSIGFVISLFSQTDTQAVQYTMLVLLASVFFSGFIMSLDSLIVPIRVISGLLPTTYGLALLRDIMLRGYSPDPILLVILFALGIAFYFFAWWMMHRLISRVQR
ncbi:MAG: ABC transporter permease, partial [Acidobacteriota bacterium]